MTAADDVDDEEPEPDPALALPPLYVLRSAAYCPECGRATPVYMLGCAAFRDEDDLRPVEEFHFLRRVERVPPAILEQLVAGCPSFHLDAGETGEPPYLMNHCACGARLDDDFVCGDVGAAFWPDTPAGFAGFRLRRLPLEQPIPIVCASMIGGGEYLDFARTWA